MIICYRRRFRIIHVKLCSVLKIIKSLSYTLPRIQPMWFRFWYKTAAVVLISERSLALIETLSFDDTRFCTDKITKCRRRVSVETYIYIYMCSLSKNIKRIGILQLFNVRIYTYICLYARIGCLKTASD